MTLKNCPRCPFESHFHRHGAAGGNHAAHGSTKTGSGPPKLTDEQKQKSASWKRLYCDYTCKNDISSGSYCSCGTSSKE